MLGIAFDPGFASNKFVYIYYTVPGSPARNRVTRFTANGDVAAAGSSVILTLDALAASGLNHNGGAIHFGVDGKLYVAVGENATGANAQLLTNRLGKMLRINKDGTIPSDNPASFQGVSGVTSGVNRAIWAIGLRNPFTFAIKRGSGRILVNDVGQSAWEEINVGGAGRNYGWPATEGPTGNPNFTSPLHAYQNNETGCAISGGAFYDSQATPFPASFIGRYFFSDLCAGRIWHINPDVGPPQSQFASGISSPIDLKVGVDGFLYYLARGEGLVGRIRPTGVTPPPPVGCSTQTQIDVGKLFADGGFAYGINMTFGTPANNSANPTRSKLRLFENGVEMGPPHTPHAQIRTLGAGRFSHWFGSVETLRLSATNNSNPKTNGRRYTFCF